jgi:hypothetical protein
MTIKVQEEIGVKPEHIVAIGGIVALIGGIITVYGGIRTSQQQTDDANKLYEAQNEGFRQVTGGDSFCYLKILPSGATDAADLVVLHEGKYPISDVSLRFVDSDQLAGPTPQGISAMDRILKAQTNIPVGTLPVKGFRLVGRIQIPAGIIEKGYVASFTARNGSWDESIRLRRTPAGDWRMALKVNENPGQVKFAELNKPTKLLFSKVDPDFPVQSSHEIQDWLGEAPKP